ncbi:MAG: conjugative transposon protein TraJ, partial [Sphingobacterium sp.]
MKKSIYNPVAVILLTMIPLASAQAQHTFREVDGMGRVLDQIYDQMMPLCQSFISVGQGIAGFAATWYIA